MGQEETRRRQGPANSNYLGHLSLCSLSLSEHNLLIHCVPRPWLPGVKLGLCHKLNPFLNICVSNITYFIVYAISEFQLYREICFLFLFFKNNFPDLSYDISADEVRPPSLSKKDSATWGGNLITLDSRTSCAIRMIIY